MPYKEKIICVYKILSPDLQECYVGSSNHYKSRISYHKKSLSCSCRILFEKYGFDNCKFVVLEQCTKEELKVKEQWWMEHSVGLVNSRNATHNKSQYNKQKARKWYLSKKLKSI